MEELKEKAGDLGNHIEDFAQTYYKLTVLRITQKVSNIASDIFISIAAGFILFFVFLFASLALAWWLGDILESRPGGFLIVAAFDILILFVLIAMRRKIIFPFIRNKVIKKVYDNED